MKRAQTTLAGSGFEKYTKTTRRAQFLTEMDRVVPQTQKGRQWYFGMKGHFGVDSRSKLIHSVEVTPAKRTPAVAAGKVNL